MPSNVPFPLAVAIAPLLCAGSICVSDTFEASNSLKFCTVVKPLVVKFNTGLVVIPLELVNATELFDCVLSKLY